MASLTNYIAFVDPGTGNSRIGHLDFDTSSIQPLAYASGKPLSNLYEVIQLGDGAQITASGDAISRDSVEVLAPISGRDVLAVGKNYAEHALEFHKSGYDSSDKVAQPSHPVIFTKRATSIVPDGHPIALLPGFTQTLDYEGEIGVIIGKPGLGIKEENALDYVWGYTIINDVTARERQRDHKQFFIGKSGDTYCPIGPVAVPAKHLPNILTIQTFLNGKERQNSTTESLIFSVAKLIETISTGITIQPGDVIATGTPAGVGFGQDPPSFLQPGDEVTIAVTGLGSLTNRVVAADNNLRAAAAPGDLNLSISNTSRIPSSKILTSVNDKSLYYRSMGPKSKTPIVFIHGLGGSQELYNPLIAAMNLEESHSLHLFDLEGHGMSPTSPLSTVTIESYAEDVKGIFDVAQLSESSGAVIIAHSMGCLVALAFAGKHPGLAAKIVLLGPPPIPLPAPSIAAFRARADTVRQQGMVALVGSVAGAEVSEATKQNNKVAVTAVRLSLLGTDPEGYAKGCSALAKATKLPGTSVAPSRFLIITGDEDRVSSPAVCDNYAGVLPLSLRPVILTGVGHWHVIENPEAVASSIRAFL